MPGPVTDAGVYELRERYHAAFGGAELPEPVEQIALVAESTAAHLKRVGSRVLYQPAGWSSFVTIWMSGKC